jgi:signal transduction histidine kinase
VERPGGGAASTRPRPPRRHRPDAHRSQAAARRRRAVGELTSRVPRRGARAPARRRRARRELSRLLRPQILDDLGLEPALRWLTRTFAERTGLALEVDLVGIDGRLQSDLETLAYRVVQEGLNNIAKHAAATRAQVLARRERGELQLVIADDGRGFDSPAPEGDGSGLRGMRDRVELFGGRIDIGSRPGKGTRIVARVPCGSEEAGGGEP